MKTYFNPAEAMQFANWLEKNGETLMGEVRATSKQLIELQASWRDMKYDQYLRIFDENTRNLALLKEDIDKYATYLKSKAAIISEYLGGRA
jgi:hypothetical protein